MSACVSFIRVSGEVELGFDMAAVGDGGGGDGGYGWGYREMSNDVMV